VKTLPVLQQLIYCIFKSFSERYTQRSTSVLGQKGFFPLQLTQHVRVKQTTLCDLPAFTLLECLK